MGEKFKVSVLISGRGSNMQSLVERAEHYRVVAVVSNRSDAAGLDFAKSQGIDTAVRVRKDAPSLDAHKHQIMSAALETAPDLVCLAGLMLIISAEFIESFDGRVINIHPALLPAYPGLDTHQRVLEAGDSVHGCSVHYVDSGIDTGPVIAQASCSVKADDTEDTLAARVLEHEHRIYPWVVNQIALGEIRLKDDRKTVWYSDVARQGAEQHSFSLPI